MKDWLSLLVCPVLRHPLKKVNGELASEIATPPMIKYPILDEIPWLFPDPKHTLHEWRERSQVLLNHLDGEIGDLKVSAGETDSPLARKRIESIRALKIRQFEFLKKTLEPLKPGKVGQKGALEKSQAFGYRLPLRQGLLGYFPNLVRDWSAHFEKENQISFDAIKDQIPLDASTVLVLGAGGARLAYDVAKAHPTATIIAFDLNPVLLFAAQSLNRGKSTQAAEFSVAPKDPSRPGQVVTLEAKLGPAPNLHFVFGDVYHLPFATESFDVCLTPWLVDILPRHVDCLLASVSQVLKSGGRWINFGSFRFDFNDPIENISHDELTERSLRFGLSQQTQRQLEIPYLQSAFDAHRRFETVSIGSWDKTGVLKDTLPTPLDDRAAWIQNPKLSIPALPVFQSSSATHAVMALVLSLVDGRKSLDEIASVIATEHGMSKDDALEATASFFDRFLKDRRFREFT
ncbi:MAG: methyltransferase domain-containing protein [Bdellovibrionaceae bacterium]|nr:methyltransferase domain-containing protein [Pseudobdellovibrionaceae bacterium]